MKLNEFITEQIYEIMKGIGNADEKLKSDEIGKIWKEDFDTLGQHLVSRGIVKGKKKNKDADAPPIMLVDFDVNLAIEEERGKGGKAAVSVGATVVSIFKAKGEVEGHSQKTTSEKSVHNVKFTIPISINPKY